VVHEDEHLLVVDKPPGWNTHAPSPYAPEGIYEWLRHREPRWAALAILHRLDKETSGLMVFGKTPPANRSLAGQFERREVAKRYLLRTDRPVPDDVLEVRTHIVRDGDRYRACGLREGDPAETRFEVLERRGGVTTVAAFPLTGRTHQIRVHAAYLGFPILGDLAYGGLPGPARGLRLASVRLGFRHPATDAPVEFSVPHGFDIDAAYRLRAAVIPGLAHGVLDETDAFRIAHGGGDGRVPGMYVDRLGRFLLCQSESAPDTAEPPVGCDGVYHKRLQRRVRGATPGEVGPEHVSGAVTPASFVVRENGVGYELSFAEGYSVGLFLDQRDNRRRLLVNHVAGGFAAFPGGAARREVLNCFAYTCAFSVCAALAGVRATSLDLSAKYLEWGRRNFALNGLDPAAHEFIRGDVHDWLRRLARKGRAFDAVLLDPPTFSRSREHGDFRAEHDYGRLVAAALGVLRPGGLLFASTNAACYGPERFLADIRAAVVAAGRRVGREHYAPQPPDHPVSRDEPAHLKTVWMRVA
jgi:23S rRNA (cytosine1962-C5)-methyltransferase